MPYRITYHPFLATYHDVMDFQGYCDAYWKWAREELENEYPNHSIEISDDISTVSAITDDEERRDEIVNFCDSLWGCCPWTEIFNREGMRTELIQADSRHEAEELAPWASVIVEVSLTEATLGELFARNAEQDFEDMTTRKGWLAFESPAEYSAWLNLRNQGLP